MPPVTSWPPTWLRPSGAASRSPADRRLPDIDVVDAYEIQLINIRQRVAEARVVGHKVGLSSKVMQQLMGVDEPDYGHLLDEMRVFEQPGEGGELPVSAGGGRGGLHPGRGPAGADCTDDDVWREPKPWSRRSS
ncbi:hypothetical protein MLAC_00020 [Mycobacterium lacus]|uniref:2-keto-4-pentenoate hydratase n=1 Tax=Mycobacterium lacus TaxID=169765 RepID=A0A7I7NE81_9MYCO|nr:hypothetical protein MLAC_00020 [Mycobacterium lacus]